MKTKTLLSLLVVVMIFSSVCSFVSASSSTNNIKNPEQEFIDTITPYISAIDQHYVFDENKASADGIDQSLIKKARKTVEDTNATIDNIIQDTYLMNYQTETMPKGSITPFQVIGDIDTDNYFDYDVKWWGGVDLWISPRMVSDMQDNNGAITGGVTLGTITVLELISKRMGIKVPARVETSITTFVGAVTSYGITTFYRNFKDTGVLFKQNWLGEFWFERP